MTLEQLKRRGFSLPNLWCFCEENEKNTEHHLVHCPRIWSLWSFLLAVLSVKWLAPLLVENFIICSNKTLVRKDENMLLKAALCCMVWEIWKEWNSVVFKDEVYTFYSWPSFVIGSDSLFF